MARPPSPGQTSTLAQAPVPAFANDTRRACRDADPNLFFADQGGNPGAEVIEAKKICIRCVFLHDCLAYAVPITDLYGVWGATTPAERQRLRARPDDWRRRENRRAER